MSFSSIRHKIRKNFKRIQDNFNNLSNKENLKENISLRTLNISAPPTIYDSGWIESLPVVNNIVPEHDPDVFVTASQGIASGAVEQDILRPVFIQCNFNLEIDIPEEFLPFLKTTIMQKNPPTVETLSTQKFDHQDWNTIPLYVIEGDGTLIFRGGFPTTPVTDRHKMSTEQLDDGDSTPSLTSKWFIGVLEYTEDGTGDDIVLTGDVHRVIATDNFFVNGGGDNFDIFTTIATSDLTSGSVTGTGTFREFRWIETSPSEWMQQVTTTKNVTRTSTFSHAVSVTMYGTKTVNGSPVSGSTHTMLAADTVTDWDLEFTVWHRVFYSSKLAKVFYMGENQGGAEREPQNLPVSTDYQTGVNPYSNITFKINEGDLPDPVDRDLLVTTTENKRWIKVKETQGITTYRLEMYGSFFCNTPVSEAKIQNFAAEDENWSNTGLTYALDGENRDNKSKDAYFPALLPVLVRLLITVDSKLLINQTEKIKNEI